MGLDITFLGDDPAATELDGQRLASVPGFLQFVLALGEIHEIEVLERFKRCVDVAAEKNVSFRIDF